MRILWIFVAALTVCHTAYSAELFATVDALSGTAYVEDQSGKSAAVTVGLGIYEGQSINSGPEGEVHLVTEDGGIIAVRPNTVFRVDEYKAEGNSSDKIFMSLLKGTIRSITGWVGKYNTSAYRITTPSATIGIRGTDHETTVIVTADGDEAGTYDNVNEGSTVLKTPQGEAEVTPGKFAFSPKGRAVAPIFLARRPHFLAARRLKIEERIQHRKEVMHGRLEQMREERRSRIKQIREHRGDMHEQVHGKATARRNELHQNRLERAGQRQQMRNTKTELGREKNQSNKSVRADRRRRAVQDNNASEEIIRRNHVRPHHEKSKRE